jgi:hypothetical protein
MDQETIRAIAAQVASKLSSHAWVLLLIQSAVLVVAAGAGAFFGEYFKTRGKHLATKADFDALQKQLRANTELVETIKAEVGQRDWARREWTNLRRIKLEALLAAVDNCEFYLERYRGAAIEGRTLEERDPHGELDTIATLYLRELHNEISHFSAEFSVQVMRMATLAHENSLAGADLAARQWNFDKYVQVVEKSKLRESITALKDAARELLVKIMDVDEDTERSPEPFVRVLPPY